MAKAANDQLSQLLNLSVIDLASKRQLRGPIRHYVNLLAALDTWREATVNLAMMPFIVIAVIGVMAGVLFIAQMWFHVSYSVLGWIGVFYLYLLILVIALPVVFPWVLLPKRAFEYLVPKSLTFMWPPLVVAAYVAIAVYIAKAPRDGPPSLWAYVTVSALAGVVFYLVLIGVVLLIVSPVEYWLKRRRNAMHPDAVVVTGLLTVLWMVDVNPEKWTEMTFKRQIMSHLEEVAWVIEHDLPRMLLTRDVATDLWLRGRAEQMAAAFRELKKWVSTPMADTRDQFNRRIADSLINVAAGEWDGLGRIEIEQASRRSLRSRMFAALRVVLIASIPMLSLWVLQRTPLSLGENVSGYAKAGVFVWAALTVLAAIDPLLGAKVAAFKDVSGILPLTGKKGE